MKLVFPSAGPVVPTRMATARSKDTTGVLSYSPGFSWRVFGITAGAEQIGFTAGEDGLYRVLTYSGLLTAADTSQLDGLASVGDRADKLTLTFNYGSTDPDVALNLGPGKDYRQVIETVTYVQCDGGVDSAVDTSPDAAGDAVGTVDVAVPRDGVQTVDVAPFDLRADIGPATVDVMGPIIINLDALPVGDAIASPPEMGKSDAAVVVFADAGVNRSDAAPVVAALDGGAAPDASSPPVTPTKPSGGGWCSFAASSPGSGGWLALFVAGLLLGFLRRRR